MVLPASTPAGVRLKPSGSPVADQVYGAVPSVALSVVENALPMTALGRVVVEMTGAGGGTVTDTTYWSPSRSSR